MKRAFVILLLLGYASLTTGCTAIVAGTAAGAYVYGMHEDNKDKRQGHGH